MGPSDPPPQLQRRLSGTSHDCKEGQAILSLTEKAPPSSAGAWAAALWPLALHLILSISIALFMLFYVNNNYFNLKERRPHVLLANGTTIPWAHRAPLQSDITTSISSSLAILRLITTAWIGPLCWRCALILMERSGLHPRQLHNLISYGIHLPRGGEQRVCLLMWVLLAIVLPVNVIAPVLTGSITWIPGPHPMGGLSGATVNISTMGDNTTSSGQWRGWNISPEGREWTSIQAVGFASLVWGRTTQNIILKRVLPSTALLEVNSTISEVTLPYFSVTKIDWVKDPQKSLTADQLSIMGVGCPKAILYKGGVCPLVRPGVVALIPDTHAQWTIRPYPSSPSIVSETRLMVIYAAWVGNYTNICPSQLKNLPPNIGTHKDGVICWAFAWVTYTAGVSTCASCRVSSYSIVQNDTELTPMKHPLTNESLLMMPTVISIMASMNATIPRPWNPDEYVTALLSRSYGASWTALTDWMADHPAVLPLRVTYTAAIPSSQALVASSRVYVWLCVQLLITISGVLFICVQVVEAKVPMIGDTTLTAFYLDSSNVYESGSDRPPKDALLKLRCEDGRLKVKVE